MDRKSLVMQAQAQAPTVPKDEKTLAKKEDEGMALRAMTETRGWKMLYENFIKTRSSINRFLQTSTTQERHEIFGALSELNDLMSYVQAHITEGDESSKDLAALRKGRTI